MSKYFKFGILIIFVSSFLSFGFSEGATVDELKKTISDREKQIAQIEAEIAEFQKQIEAKASEASTLKNQIAKLEAIVKQLNAEIRLTQSKINAAELNLQKIGVEINDKNEEIEERKASLAEIIRAVYQSDNESLMEVLINYDEISEFFVDARDIQDLEKAIGDDLGMLKNLKHDLEGREVEEASVKKQLQNLASELSDRRSIEEQSKKTRSQLLTETKNKEAEYQKLVREREKQRGQILDDIRKIEDELRLLIDASSLPSARPGVLGWPVLNPKITQNFGRTEFAANTDVYGGKGHNGVDLRAAVGTPILSAENGIVKGTGNSDIQCPGGSYGKWVLVEHPNKLSTLYAHLSFIKVSTGQEVKRGEVVGYSGDTGYTTGPHLHFTVYDARTVQIKPSRVCGLLPYGGYLDPIVYL